MCSFCADLISYNFPGQGDCVVAEYALGNRCVRGVGRQSVSSQTPNLNGEAGFGAPACERKEANVRLHTEQVKGPAHRRYRAPIYLHNGQIWCLYMC